LRRLLIALVVAATAVPIAAAADVDRVQVGLPGRNTTRAFSSQTFVVVTTPAAYTRLSFDGDAGSWRGPRCVVSSRPDLSADVRVPWALRFSDTYASREDAADRARTFRDLPELSRGTIAVPHRIRGKGVGAISAYYVLGQSGEDYGWAEVGLGIPLTRGVFAAMRFWSTGPSFACNVGTTSSRQWHVDAVQAAAARVVVDGNLPAARITAHGARRRMSGFVNDGFGHPVVGARVTLQRRDARGTWRAAGTATTAGNGFYSARAVPGAVRAVHGSLRSAPTRVR
jgi:hypothetical protein